MFVLVDDHGSPLGEFSSRTQAVRALIELVRADPSAALECGVVELDERGQRVGEDIVPLEYSARFAQFEAALQRYIVDLEDVLEEEERALSRRLRRFEPPE